MPGNALASLGPVMQQATGGNALGNTLKEGAKAFFSGFNPEAAKGFEQEAQARQKDQLGKTLAWLQQTKQIPEVEREAWTMQNADAIARDTGADPRKVGSGVSGGMGSSPYADAELDKAIAAISAGLGQGPVTGEAYTLAPGAKRMLGNRTLAENPRTETGDGGYTLAPGAVRYGPDGKMVSENPRAASDQGFTLSPGGARYGPDGKLLAERPGLPRSAGIRIAPDGTVLIGGPAEDGTQLTGPNPNEKGYYKDIGAYQAAKNQREILLDNLKKSKGMVSWDTTGIVGSVMKNVAGSKAVNLGERLKTVKALIGFDALQQMRNNSPTGGALGAITEKELAFLQSVQGSLDQVQSEKQLDEQIDEIETSMKKLGAAQDAAFQVQYQGLQPGQTRDQPRVAPGGKVSRFKGMSTEELQRRKAELSGGR